MTTPESKGNRDSVAMVRNADIKTPNQPIQRKIFPARVNEPEMLSFVLSDDSLSSSKRLSNPESSFIFLILC